MREVEIENLSFGKFSNLRWPQGCRNVWSVLAKEIFEPEKKGMGKREGKEDDERRKRKMVRGGGERR